MEEVYEFMKVRMLSLHGYPKELKRKYYKFGIEYLTDREILELLLLYAKPLRDIRNLADNLISQYGDFPQILDEPLNNLVAFPGMDTDTAILLKLIKDCPSHYFKKKACKKYSIRGGPDLIKYCQMSMASLSNEQFRVVFLNIQNEIIEIETLQEGTLNEAAVYPRRVIERALYHRATALIFVHNHTSGNVRPSSFDINITQMLMKAASAVDIEVYDHLIIGQKKYYSFRDSGLM